MAQSHDAQGMSTRPKLGSESTIKNPARPGGPGGNTVKGTSSGSATGASRPGGPGGNKTVSSPGGPVAPRPGGSQPASGRRQK